MMKSFNSCVVLNFILRLLRLPHCDRKFFLGFKACEDKTHLGFSEFEHSLARCSSSSTHAT